MATEATSEQLVCNVTGRLFVNIVHQHEGSLSLYPPYSKKGGHSETLLSTCIAHSKGAYLHLPNGVRTFRPMQFQPMQFQPLPIQPFTISTACNFIRSHFQPFAISTYGNFNLSHFHLIALKPC